MALIKSFAGQYKFAESELKDSGYSNGLSKEQKTLFNAIQSIIVDTASKLYGKSSEPSGSAKKDAVLITTVVQNVVSQVEELLDSSSLNATTIQELLSNDDQIFKLEDKIYKSLSNLKDSQKNDETIKKLVGKISHEIASLASSKSEEKREKHATELKKFLKDLTSEEKKRGQLQKILTKYNNSKIVLQNGVLSKILKRNMQIESMQKKASIDSSKTAKYLKDNIRQAKIAQVSISDKMIDNFKKVTAGIEKVQEVVNKISFRQAAASAMSWIAKIGKFLALGLLVSLVFGKFSFAGGILKALFGPLTSLLSGFTATFIMNPLNKILKLIVGEVKLGFKHITATSIVTDPIGTLKNFWKETAKPIWDNFKKQLESGFNFMFEFGKKIWHALKFIVEPLQKLFPSGENIKKAWKELTNAVENVIPSFGDTVDAFSSLIPKNASISDLKLFGGKQGFIDFIKHFYSDEQKQKIQENFTMSQQKKDSWNESMNKIKKLLSPKGGETYKSIFTEFWDRFKKSFEELWNILTDKIKEHFWGKDAYELDKNGNRIEAGYRKEWKYNSESKSWAFEEVKDEAHKIFRTKSFFDLIKDSIVKKWQAFWNETEGRQQFKSAFIDPVTAAIKQNWSALFSGVFDGSNAEAFYKHYEYKNGKSIEIKYDEYDKSKTPEYWKQHRKQYQYNTITSSVEQVGPDEQLVNPLDYLLDYLLFNPGFWTNVASLGQATGRLGNTLLLLLKGVELILVCDFIKNGAQILNMLTLGFAGKLVGKGKDKILEMLFGKSTNNVPTTKSTSITQKPTELSLAKNQLAHYDSEILRVKNLLLHGKDGKPISEISLKTINAWKNELKGLEKNKALIEGVMSNTGNFAKFAAKHPKLAKMLSSAIKGGKFFGKLVGPLAAVADAYFFYDAVTDIEKNPQKYIDWTRLTTAIAYSRPGQEMIRYEFDRLATLVAGQDESVARVQGQNAIRIAEQLEQLGLSDKLKARLAKIEIDGDPNNITFEELKLAVEEERKNTPGHLFWGLNSDIHKLLYNISNNVDYKNEIMLKMLQLILATSGAAATNAAIAAENGMSNSADKDSNPTNVYGQ